MLLRAGERHGGGRFICLIILLNVVLFSAGVTATQEENKIIHEEQPAELQKATVGHAPGPAVRVDEPNKGNLGFIHAFVAALSVIIVSELGDKTFFIAAIMAMRYNRLTVLVPPNFLSVFSLVLFGYATTIIPRIYTYYISTALFAIFGLRMLREGLRMSPDEGQKSSEELEEVQAEIKKKDEELQRYKLANGAPDVEAGTATISPQRKWHSVISPIFIQALTLTFLAEWGDRSQLATIVLAAREDPFGVAVGGTLGHCLCTGLAVIGGRMVAQKISVRTVTIIGGIVFLAFAFSALFIKPDSGILIGRIDSWFHFVYIQPRPSGTERDCTKTADGLFICLSESLLCK
ncbi:transmembrane protein 165 [Cyprinus carpio]|uniref:GDT1 family protein n=1 Tax=Cyprinus carpio TaxID=7962 RepID=A0A9Q9Z6Z2_CYPCA|nr:transmembrane protein 165 [Cyprinus carpio]